jgi:asparagine synthase (glutamine-hydrolysing)
MASALLAAPSARMYNRLARPLAAMLPRGFTRKSPGHRVHQIAQVLAQPQAEGMYQWLVSHWRDRGVVAGHPPKAPYVLNDPAQWPALSSLTERMMYLDLAGYLPDDILVKVDRASMAVSLEARVPLLDHRVIEFAWRLPQNLKVRGGVGKWVLREVLAGYVPRELTDRPKMGFGVPVDHWLRGPLRAWAEELLEPARMLREGYFNPAPIREKWAQHLDGTNDWHHLLWDVLMFQAWLRQSDDGEIVAHPDGRGLPAAASPAT